MLKLTAGERAILARPVDPELDIEIRPDKIVFIPAVVIRRRLDETFGPGRWALRQEQLPVYDPETNECLYDGSLWIDGKFVSRSMGGCSWRPGNRRMTKSDAIEGARSDCLKRCVKDLGIGSEVALPSWRTAWIDEHATPYIGIDRDGKRKEYWRKKGQALSGEGLANASGIGGEFPSGFNPDTAMPDGEYAGQPLRDVPDEFISKMAEKAQSAGYRLAAKAEIVRRCREDDQQPDVADVELPTVDEVLGETTEGE